MAVKKNDVALSFDKAEYYSLQEASDYLNRKHEIDNITPRKLLKQALSRNCPLFIYTKGLDVDIYSSIEKIESHAYNLTITRIHEDMNEMVNDENFINGLLLELNPAILKKFEILRSKKVIIDSFSNDFIPNFIGLLFTNTITNDSKNLSFLTHEIIPNFAQYFKLNNIGIYIYFAEWIAERFEPDYLEKRMKDFKPKVVSYESVTFTGEGGHYTPNLEIGLQDLIIIHKDLEKLETQILENAPVPEKELIKLDSHGLPKRQGITPRLQHAKLIANVHAQHLWAKHHDKKILIGEMCERIKAYLAETEYSDQLPERAESIKDWLNNTPEYAHNGGRPSNS